MRLILMRHAATAANRSGVCVGRTDEPLCDEGIVGAIEMGQCPDVDRVFVSPLRRARQTAGICFPCADQLICEDLSEMDFGDFEGKTHEEKIDDPRYVRWLEGWCEGPCPGGESKDEFTKRTLRGLARCVEDAILAGDDSLVVVAHGGTIMASMSEIARESGRSYFEWHVGNCEGFCINLVDPSGTSGLTEGLRAGSYFGFSTMAEILGFLEKGGAPVEGNVQLHDEQP